MWSGAIKTTTEGGHTERRITVQSRSCVKEASQVSHVAPSSRIGNCGTSVVAPCDEGHETMARTSGFRGLEFSAAGDTNLARRGCAR